MIPDPLHPAVVHFPMALVVLLPLGALWALWAIRRGLSTRTAWAVPLALAGLLTLSSWAALETGQDQEEVVEDVVGDAPIHEHEERAELFLILSGVLTLVAGAGLLGSTVGQASRLVATVGAFGLVVAGVRVGASGGDLVYEHGAASAYVTGGSATADAPVAGRERDGDEDEH